MLEAMQQTVEQTEQPIQLDPLKDVLENSRGRHALRSIEDPYAMEGEDMVLFAHSLNEISEG